MTAERRFDSEKLEHLATVVPCWSHIWVVRDVGTGGSHFNGRTQCDRISSSNYWSCCCCECLGTAVAVVVAFLSLVILLIAITCWIRLHSMLAHGIVVLLLSFAFLAILYFLRRRRHPPSQASLLGL